MDIRRYVARWADDADASAFWTSRAISCEPVTNSSDLDGFADLPDELILHILSFCGIKVHCRLSQVSKNFKAMADESPVWRQVLALRLPSSLLQIEKAIARPSPQHYKSAIRHVYELAFAELTRDRRLDGYISDAHQHAMDFLAYLLYTIAVMLVLLGVVLSSLQLGGVLWYCPLLATFVPLLVGLAMLTASALWCAYQDPQQLPRLAFAHFGCSAFYGCLFLLLAGLRALFPALPTVVMLLPMYLLLVQWFVFLCVCLIREKYRTHAVLMFSCVCLMTTLILLNILTDYSAMAQLNYTVPFIVAALGYTAPLVYAVCELVAGLLCRSYSGKEDITYPLLAFAVLCGPFATHTMLTFGVNAAYAAIPLELVLCAAIVMTAMAVVVRLRRWLAVRKVLLWHRINHVVPVQSWRMLDVDVCSSV